MNSLNVGRSKAVEGPTARLASSASERHARPTSRSPSGPSQHRYARPASASSVWLVVMLDVAFSRRMCCSRVWSVRTYPRFPVEVVRLADDPARQTADVLALGGHEPVVRPAVAHVVPGGLALADRERAAVVARRLEHAERQEIDMGHRERTRRRRGGGDVRRRFEAAEEVGLLEDHARGVLGRRPHRVGVGRATVVRHLDDLHPESRRERLARRAAPAGSASRRSTTLLRRVAPRAT